MKFDIEFVLLDPNKVLLGASYHKSLMFESLQEEDEPDVQVEGEVYSARILTIGFFFFYVSLLIFIPME